MDVDALMDTQRAFDAVAPTYHRANVENPILAAMRARVWQAVERYVPPGSHLLDLGCGPGTDEAHLAARGYRITAIDLSPAMVREARQRVRARGLDALVRVEPLGIHDVDRLAPAEFDAAWSNLGALNCVTDLDEAASAIGRRLRPGGMLIASVVGRVCPWEIALYAWRRDWRRIRVRYGRTATAVPLDGGRIWTQYYSPAAFERTFAGSGFRCVERRALGLFAPPPYMQAFAERHPRLIDRLQRLDGAVGAGPGLRAWGDHFLVVMRKV